MRRRAFIAGIVSAAAWPLAVRAQQQRIARIGYLAFSSSDRAARFVRTNLKAAKALGLECLLRSLCVPTR
jgi:hypothetical protein